MRQSHEAVTVHYRKSDIRKVAVTCSCGSRSVAEIPKQSAKTKNLHTCPSCQKVHIFQFIDGKWTHTVFTQDIEQMFLS